MGFPTEGLTPEIDKAESPLDQLVAAVLSSPKYRSVCADFIKYIGARELSKRRSLKEAIKATKNKLHQVGGAYLGSRMEYTAWLQELKAARTDPMALRAACARIMAHHASTRERLPILDRFYTTALADLAPVHSVLDVACGLNPLAIPWMPLARDAVYCACDIYQDMADFLNQFLALISVRGRVSVCDVIQYNLADTGDLTQRVQVAFVLKTIPCLEQVDRSASLRLLDALNAEHMLVSFPRHSLGGHDVGMTSTYAARFEKLIASRGWPIQRFDFATELAYLVTKTPASDR
ncbi:MAG: 16S rRNA methyltransferase [Anaerolineae bacterium]|nr:16S rRNA methyltransferase [Anaerolineae bacterium]MDW8099876.1 16S rRNA methyltransferase [Anaerolineae bacterium]